MSNAYSAIDERYNELLTDGIRRHRTPGGGVSKDLLAIGNEAEALIEGEYPDEFPLWKLRGEVVARSPLPLRDGNGRSIGVTLEGFLAARGESGRPDLFRLTAAETDATFARAERVAEAEITRAPGRTPNPSVDTFLARHPDKPMVKPWRQVAKCLNWRCGFDVPASRLSSRDDSESCCDGCRRQIARQRERTARWFEPVVPADVVRLHVAPDPNASHPLALRSRSWVEPPPEIRVTRPVGARLTRDERSEAARIRAQDHFNEMRAAHARRADQPDPTQEDEDMDGQESRAA